VTGELVAADVAFLTCQENFGKKFLAALGFISGVKAFHSGLIVTMTWLHCSVPLGLNVNVSSFPLMLSLMIPTATSIVAPAVLKNAPPKNKRCMMTDIHLEYHEVHGYERILDSHRDIFCNSHRMPDRLIYQLQMHGSRDQGIMIQMIVDYLWHNAHACSEIPERLIKLLGANQTRDGRNTCITHLIRKTIKDSSTTSFRKHEPVHFGYWSLLVEDILQIPCISQDLHGIQHWNVDVHSSDYFHEATEFLIFHMPLCLMGE
jgi:hypothetical protein